MNSSSLAEMSWQPAAYAPDRPTRARFDAAMSEAIPDSSAPRTYDAAAASNMPQIYEAQPFEFVISSDWALRSEGVKHFYEVLYQHDENLEIVYDPSLHAFRVKCLSGQEFGVIVLVKRILRQLVLAETQNGLDMNAKLISPDEWEENNIELIEEIDVPDKFSYPRDVALCDFRKIWNISKSLSEDGITTNMLYPESALSKLRRLTGAVLIASSDGRTIYIGASKGEDVRTAERKLGTLAKFFSLTPRDTTQVMGIYLHSEGDESTMGEYRFLADGNEPLLRGYILDRFDWSNPTMHYSYIFRKGATVRLNPNNEPWNEVQSLSNTILPAVKDRHAKEEFRAFNRSNWAYPAKGAQLSPLDTLVTEQCPGLTSHQIVLRPKIENWVSSIPMPITNEYVSCRQTESRVGVPASPPNPSSDSATCVEPEQDPRGSVYGECQQSFVDSQYDHQSEKSVATTGAKSSAITAEDDQGIAGSFDPEPCRVPVNTLLHDGCGTTSRRNLHRCVDAVKPLASKPDDHAPAVVHKQYNFSEHDPFANLYKECRQILMGGGPKLRKMQSDRSSSDESSPIDRTEPQVTRNHEKDFRSYHTTMNQQTESRAVSGGTRTRPMFDPNTMVAINKSLVKLMAPLTMWPGHIDLRIDLGRFCFLNVQTSHIQELANNDDEKYYGLEQIRDDLNNKHTAQDKLCFTRVLTTLGADANYIANLVDEGGKQMWMRPKDGRSSFYEFTCRSTTANGGQLDFVVDIDATTFTAKVKQFKCDQNCFAVYCTKRAWDFQIVLSVSRGLNELCARFARDLACSLQVRPMIDQIPELEVSYEMSYDIEILAVRTRNEACCVSEVRPNKLSSTPSGLGRDVQKLYISEIWEMDRISKTQNEQRVRITFGRCGGSGDPLGVPSVWYEASLKSDALSNAFRQNEKLELGDEASWTAEELLKSGTVDDLVRKAASMVKKMDGIGYWNDNQQQRLSAGVAPVRKDAKVDDRQRSCY